MSKDPDLRQVTEDADALESADTEGHIRYLLDEQGNPDVARRDDEEDTEGHRKI